MTALDCRAWFTAWLAISVEWPTCRPISATALESSSEAAATVRTFDAGCSDAAATAVDCRVVSSALAASPLAVLLNCPADCSIVLRVIVISPLKASMAWLIRFWRACRSVTSASW